MDWWRSERSRTGGVDEIPLPIGAGRMWLCGKHFVGPDPEAALARTGADAIVCLNEASELSGRYPDYVDWLKANSPDRAMWHPIHDLHVPAAAEAGPFLGQLDHRLAAGDGLLIHCGAGIGRAGTIAAALLIMRGLSVADALSTVAAHRPSAGPQTTEQAGFLELLA